MTGGIVTREEPINSYSVMADQCLFVHDCKIPINLDPLFLSFIPFCNFHSKII